MSPFAAGAIVGSISHDEHHDVDVDAPHHDGSLVLAVSDRRHV
jgi:hypothetical protein